MMPNSRDIESEPISVFAKSVETVFRKLIRFLVGRVSLVNLQEMIRHIYVEEAEQKLQTHRPGRNVPLTKLALVTGLDTRTVAHIRTNILESKNKFTQLALKELTPESAIVEAWAERVSVDSNGGNEHRELSYDGPDSEFEKLFRSVITSRGVTSRSLLERLVATESVELDKENKTVKLVVDQFSPYFSDDEPNAVNAALSAISNLVSTVENNVGAKTEDRFFQRQAWSFRLSPKEISEFRVAVKKFLENADRQARSEMEPWEQSEFGDALITAGVGLYYFEESD